MVNSRKWISIPEMRCGTIQSQKIYIASFLNTSYSPARVPMAKLGKLFSPLLPLLINCNFSEEVLFKLLKAYTVLHPEEGYCQAQAPIAAVLLMHMPVRDAFFCFVQVRSTSLVEMEV